MHCPGLGPCFSLMPHRDWAGCGMMSSSRLLPMSCTCQPPSTFPDPLELPIPDSECQRLLHTASALSGPSSEVGLRQTLGYEQRVTPRPPCLAVLRGK